MWNRCKSVPALGVKRVAADISECRPNAKQQNGHRLCHAITQLFSFFFQGRAFVAVGGGGRKGTHRHPQNRTRFRSAWMKKGTDTVTV